MTDTRRRCQWAGTDPLYVAYHDTQWGVPAHDDRELFEMVILEGVQAGLSWITVLRKREHYRKVFDNFAAENIAQYGQDKIADLLADPGIIRNRLKVAAAIDNAKAFLSVRQEFGSFDRYIWRFVHGKPIVHAFAHLSDYPTKIPEAEAMSKDLRKRGFRFVGPTICYAYMQAVGMVNDHQLDCFRRSEV